MAVLTALDLDAARAIGARYGLDVEAVKGIPAGSVNSNYQLSLRGGGRVFLRIYEEQGTAAAEKEVFLLEHLSACAVPTPRPITVASGGGFLSEHAGKPVALFPWVDGEVACQARVTAAHAHAVGAALARVHVAGAGFHTVVTSRFRPPDLLARVDALPSSAHEGALGRDVARLRQRLETFGTTPEPRGIIHGDLFRDNVLWSDPAAAAPELRALLDFESASLGSFAFDLAVTALAWCFGAQLDASLANALGAGYSGVRPLDARDRAELPSQARFAAVRFAITRITDFELRPRGTGVYKDYRRFLARLDALDALGDERIRELLAG